MKTALKTWWALIVVLADYISAGYNLSSVPRIQKTNIISKKCFFSPSKLRWNTSTPLSDELWTSIPAVWNHERKFIFRFPYWNAWSSKILKIESVHHWNSVYGWVLRVGYVLAVVIKQTVGCLYQYRQNQFCSNIIHIVQYKLVNNFPHQMLCSCVSTR